MIIMCVGIYLYIKVGIYIIYIPVELMSTLFNRIFYSLINIIQCTIVLIYNNCACQSISINNIYTMKSLNIIFVLIHTWSV